MNWEAIGAVGESIGATAVLATLAYLAIQMRQNTQAMKSAGLRSMQDMFFLTENNERYIGHIMQIQRGEFVSPEDRAHMVERFYSIMRTIERIWREQKLGNLTTEDFEQHLDLLRWAMSHPSAHLIWQVMGKRFDDEFQAIVQTEALADDAPPGSMVEAFVALQQAESSIEPRVSV
jgi:hypothetical protein